MLLEVHSCMRVNKIGIICSTALYINMLNLEKVNFELHDFVLF